MKRIVLAYSGGLDTSVAIPWLKDRYGAEIVSVTMDLGQGKELNDVRERALAIGSVRAHVVDVREEFAREYILPALQAGAMVVSDRFSLSSLAYQGYGRGLPLDEIRAADAAATGGVRPDLTLVIDVPLETVLARVGERADRFEGEGREFLQRVISGYRRLAAEDPTVRLIDGRVTVEAVQQAIRHTMCSVATPDRGGNT